MVNTNGITMYGDRIKVVRQFFRGKTLSRSIHTLTIMCINSIGKVKNTVTLFSDYPLSLNTHPLIRHCSDMGGYVSTSSEINIHRVEGLDILEHDLTHHKLIVFRCALKDDYFSVECIVNKKTCIEHIEKEDVNRDDGNE
jgi:putative lipoic acid-binding regulatory protein